MNNCFKRVEKKYLLTKEQMNRLINILNKEMIYDPYCKNGETYHIQNIYLDTLDNTLIRTSLTKPLYKEKIRVRSYDGEKLFLEVKKKYDGVVGKRRVEITQDELDNFLKFNIKPERKRYTDIQSINELSYIFSNNKVFPKVYIAYDRLGYYSKDNLDFRLTFDTNIFYSKSNLSWNQGIKDENRLIKECEALMEIKMSLGYPLWLTEFLSKEKIYPVSFSKYGTEFNKDLKELLNV